MKLTITIKDMKIKNGTEEVSIGEISISAQVDGSEIKEVLSALPKKVWKEAIKASSKN